MIKLSAADLRAILPRAPQAVIDAFAAKQDLLTKAGINATRSRMAYFFANIEHECGSFTIPNLTENINYTAARMAQVWPNRFKSASAVQAKYGTGAGWQRRAFDDIYGNRMGNRPGTSDGSRYIGRGGPQWTGRDGYQNLQRLTGLPAVDNPEIATRLDLQPEVCTAFWIWKNLNRFADAGDFVGCVKAWNGGTNGLADRQHLMSGNDPIIKRLETVNSIAPTVPDPKKPVATKEDAAKAGGGAVVAGTVAAGVQQGWGIFEWAIAAAVVIAIAVVGYFAWRWWQEREEKPAALVDVAPMPTAEAHVTPLMSSLDVWKQTPRGRRRKTAKQKTKPQRKVAKKRKAA
jgi:predicted chitinase